ncbi:MAG: glycosyltransferase family 2 protein [Coleofasciculus sp.]
MSRSNPCISIIIPTYNRPHLLPRAVKSALEQTIDDLEVIVVDDGSSEPVVLPEYPRLRIIRQSVNRGTAAARNAGAKAARGSYITYLDDDDQLLPQMAEVSLTALANTTLPQPVAVLSGLEVVDLNGNVTQRRIPPTLPRGKHFFLEEIEPEQSFLSKQTLMVERELLLGIGGYDESFSSRVHTEIFLRLNPVCSILGLPIVTYQMFVHEGSRISRDPSLRQASFNQLLRKHGAIFKAHPKMFADFVYKHALKSYELNQKRAAFLSVLLALRIHPTYTLSQITESFWHSLSESTGRMLTEPLKSN